MNVENSLQWRLRIKLWHDDINIPEDTQVNIINVHKQLKDIMRKVSGKMPGWIILDRLEASIGTMDEKKQIRESKDIINRPKSYIDFHSLKCDPGENISVKEWQQFAKAIQPEIELIIHNIPEIFLFTDLTS